jgi:hypothetical protein
MYAIRVFFATCGSFARPCEFLLWIYMGKIEEVIIRKKRYFQSKKVRLRLANLLK